MTEYQRRKKNLQTAEDLGIISFEEFIRLLGELLEDES